MAAKRFFNEPDSNPDPHNEKRRRTGPSFASVIREVVAGNFLQNFCTVLEPMLRRVVNEEIEVGLRRGARSLSRSNSFRIQAVEPSSLKLSFSDRLCLPIFTGSKIVDLETNPLQILLLDTRGDRMILTALSYPIKIEIVVLDGDFPHDNETWTSEEFEKNIVRERNGKRPLLTGDLNVTMRDGAVPIGEIEFTDNSSWIRSRKFRLGARVVQRTSQGAVQIQEAMTQAFVVKDHRGELYKKHHPPMLEDEVWRLEKIGKDGAFHKKLASEGINTVQDFLKLSTVAPAKLRSILGIGMSEKMWEVSLKHARNCVMGSKLYIYTGSNHTIILNPICQIVKAMVNGQTYATRDLTSLNRGYIENLVRSAYANWNSLQVVDGQLSETPLLTQGDIVDQCPTIHQTFARSYQQHAFFTDGSAEATSMANDAHAECSDWVVSSAYICTPIEGGVRSNFPDSSSDGELTTTARSFVHGS